MGDSGRLWNGNDFVPRAMPREDSSACIVLRRPRSQVRVLKASKLRQRARTGSARPSVLAEILSEKKGFKELANAVQLPRCQHED